MSNSLKINTKGMEFILKNMEKLEGAELRVGIVGGEPRESSDGGAPTNAEIAVKHEFGLGVPRRSFLRDPMLRLLPEVERLIANATSKADREQMLDALEEVGAWLAGALQKNLANGVPPPNAQSTIDRKGSSKPLIDTGQLRAAISHVLKRG